MVQYLLKYLGFLDETSKNERTLTKGYRRLKKGQRVTKKAVFKCGRWTSIKTLLSLDGIVTCKAVERSMIKKLLLEWLKFNVVHNLIIITYDMHIQSLSTF